MSKSVSKTRFYIYIIALLPFILLIATGLILLKYHTGAPPASTVMGFDGSFWFASHKILALITFQLILLHLYVKSDWIKRFFTFKIKGSFKLANILLFVVFLLCVITALASGMGSSVFGGIHNKLGLLLIILFLIHLWNYRKVIINQFKK